LNKNTSFKIYPSCEQLPGDWDTVAQPNIFLSRAYLTVLEKSAPQNMECHFIGLFSNDKLCGIALAQYINLSRINTFAEEKKSFTLKDYVFKKFSSHILIIGNNTLTGQNAYVLNSDIAEHDALMVIKKALYSLKADYGKKGICINLLAIKDFNEEEFPDFEKAGFKTYFKFCTQPNMIFSIRPEWNGLQDYIFNMNTKYRTQYNRARKKAEGIDKKQLTAEEIKTFEDKIHSLYLTVADNAAFNTFYLPKDHFYIFKEQLKEDFLFYGYFLNSELVGFQYINKEWR
jgi:hypothetical protein